jgi:bifunctional UDP-N-acetylglucosamine pyrophosphorylase/glucosamine-1-phosphate N-acetyltransferase
LKGIMEHLVAGILAGGRGVRMKSDRPKVLHDVCGRPVLRHVAEAAAGLGADRLRVVTGPDGEPLRRALDGVENVDFVVQPEPLGTGDALRVLLGESDVTGGLLVLPGDVPLLKAKALRRFLERHRTAGADLSVLTFEPAEPGMYGRIVRDSGGAVSAIVEARDADEEVRRIREVNTGIYLMDADAARRMVNRLSADNDQGEFYLTDLVELTRKEGGSVEGVKAGDPGDFLGVNTRADLAEASRRMRDRILGKLMEEGVTVVDPAGTWVECGVTVGRDTVLHPFTVLRSGVRIGRGCSVGPFAHLRGDTVLEDGAAVGNFTEVKSSRLGAGARALHLSYLGDAEVGEGTNVGAGAITANFDGERKHATVLGKGVRVGSNTVFVAPVKAGDGAVTGAGAVVTRDVRPGQTVAGVPARPLSGNPAEKGGRDD